MDKLPPEAVAALERGRLIEAIKIVRDATGLDLKSAKEAVERYANRIEGQAGNDGDDGKDWQEGDWGRSASANAPAPMTEQLSALPSLPAAALSALAQGNKVEAIRLTRNATGLDLAGAKRLVEGHQNPLVGEFGHLPQGLRRDPMAEPGRVNGGAYKWMPVLIVLLVVAMVWLYFGGAKP